jgi:hypothetical protein
MRPFATTPAKDCYAALPMADFADAFSLDVTGRIDAPEAAKQAVGRMPGWIARLVTLRNLVVAPLGLKTSADATAQGGLRIGSFPVVSSTPGRVVLGFDDKHLDFRIVVDVSAQAASGQRVTVTTLVKRHAVFGRIYLAIVMPFHKRIVPAMMAQVTAD